ncbi:MAG: septum formation inhibitor Maf, partial [Mycobacterium sp.]|nr:septum formation inhibitor Maf [Mycobacterium sp.]
MTRVVLGSASPGRRKVLRQAGIDPLMVVSGVDEDAIIKGLGDAPPHTVTTKLATAKAEKVTHELDASVADDCVVIGCDSMLYCEGELRGKPTSPDDAKRQWQTMAGRTGQLHTGHCVIRLRNNEAVHQSAESLTTAVHFATPSHHELDAYIASGEPLNVAGGFTLDGLGGWFVDGVDGDPSSVIGISLP